MLHQSKLPSSFWCYAFSTATFLVNRLPSSVLGFKSPWEKLFHNTPSLQVLKPFGCACFPFLKPYIDNKFQPKSTQCIFLGYPPLSKGYICYEPQSQKVYITSHVIFHESVFPTLPAPLSAPSCSAGSDSPSFDLWLSTLLPTSAATPLSAISDVLPSFINPSFTTPRSDTASNVSTDAVLPLSSTLVPTSSVVPSQSASFESTNSVLQSDSSSHPNTHPMLTRSKHGTFKPKAFAIVRDYFQVEPPSFNVASRFPHWIEAMDSEFHSLQKQHTWSLVPLPPAKNVVHCK